MPALSIQMHFHGNAGILERDVVSQRVIYIVHMVIFRLQQKHRRRLSGDVEIRVQSQIGCKMAPGNELTSGIRQMKRVGTRIIATKVLC